MVPISTSKFHGFDKFEKVYDVVNGHSLEVSILIPQEPQHTPNEICPILVFWHGGAFIVGDRLYEPWWSDWLIDFSRSQNAIIISPNYRLLPEANGSDVLDDISSFWYWLHGNLSSIAESWPMKPDLSRILCAGQSSGGFQAMQSALLNHGASIKAIVSISAPLYVDIPDFTIPHQRNLMGSKPLPPREAEAIIRRYRKQVTTGTIRTVGDPTTMWELVTSIMQQGHLPKLLNLKSDERLDIMARLDKVESMPPMWLLHGEQDTLVNTKLKQEYITSS